MAEETASDTTANPGTGPTAVSLDDQTLARVIEGVAAKLKEARQVAPEGTTPGTSATTSGKS